MNQINNIDKQELNTLTLAERKELIDYTMKASYSMSMKVMLITFVAIFGISGIIITLVLLLT
jgi:uncharacterized protein YjgD (DUF1641 family)